MVLTFEQFNLLVDENLVNLSKILQSRGTPGWGRLRKRHPCDLVGGRGEEAVGEGVEGGMEGGGEWRGGGWERSKGWRVGEEQGVSVGEVEWRSKSGVGETSGDGEMNGRVRMRDVQRNGRSRRDVKG